MENQETIEWMQQLGENLQTKSNNHQNEQTSKRKCGAAKKRDRIQQKIKIYGTIEAKKQRQKTTKQRIQRKKRAILQGMSKQEAQVYLKNQKQQKIKTKQKMLQGLQEGLPIFIDCAYEDNMNVKQRKSLSMQIQLIYKQMKQVDKPCSLHVCGVGEGLMQNLTKMQLHKMPIGIHQEDVVKVGKNINKKLIYLSPDSTKEIKQVSSDHAYVIGGLVDRTILKNASLSRAGQLGIQAYRLPINQFMVNRKCLNINHVAMMLVKAQQTNNWKQAFYFSAPKRFSRQKGTLQKSQSQEGSFSQDPNQDQIQKQLQQKTQQQKLPTQDI